MNYRYSILPMMLSYFILIDIAFCNHLDTLVDERIDDERESQEHEFIITPHKANYLLPVSYNTNPHQTPFIGPNGLHPNGIQNIEARFQISVKVPLWKKVIGDDGSLFFAFTSQSWWQVYNEVISSPFRETDYEPELYLLFHNNWRIGGFTNTLWNIGIAHQSNGQSGSLSRSWNRVFAHMLFDGGNLVFIPKVWVRIPQQTVEFRGVIYGDENPGIENYLGNFELLTIYGLKKHRFTLLLRNNLSADNRGAVKVTWSYPIYDNLRLYAEYFNGYGDSLLEYNTQTQVFGIGIALNDLL